MNPIIFLDIDGVLNSRHYFIEKDGNDPSFVQIDPKKVGWLNNLCDEMNIDIVVSSTWRKGRTLEELVTLLRYLGCTFNVVGVTRNLNKMRGIEIDTYLEENFGSDAGLHPKYVILDDDSDMLDKQRSSFLHVDGYYGMSPNTCYRIKNYFTGKYPLHSQEADYHGRN